MILKLRRPKLRTVIKEYILISFGMLLFSFAWTNILQPAGTTGGGAGGVALLVKEITGGDNGGIPMWITVLAVNSILIGIATFFIDAKFGAKTIYAILFMTFSMAVLEQFVPGNLLGLANDKLLTVILGAVVAGVGVSICFTQGGSTGGTDIVALIVNQYKTISYGRVIMFCDSLIICCSVLVFKDITSAIYGFVMIGVYGYTIDAVMAGNRQSTQIFIVSPRYEQIAERIFEEMKRGVTLVNGEGWYSKNPTKIVMVVCRKNETSILFRVIKDVDPDAFMTFGSVMGVYGKGFDPLKK